MLSIAIVTGSPPLRVSKIRDTGCAFRSVALGLGLCLAPALYVNTVLGRLRGFCDHTRLALRAPNPLLDVGALWWWRALRFFALAVQLRPWGLYEEIRFYLMHDYDLGR